MTLKLSQILIVALLVSLLSSWLTITVVGQSVFEKARNRSAFITQGGNGCSGVILQTNLILTANHCVDGKEMVFANGKEAQILKADKLKDLALLLVETIIVNRVRIQSVSVGDDVFSFGYPMSSPNVVYTKGHVNVIQYESIFASTVSLPGSSGSGLFDMNGNLVGLVGGYNQHFSVNYPWYKIQSFWEVK